MLTTMKQVSVTSLLLILGIFCLADSAHACNAGEFACAPGASRRCIPHDWVCDDSNDCGDGSDENDDMCGNFTCPDWQVTCEGESPSRRCIFQSWMCDGYNDCGNDWDEDPDNCGLVAVRNCKNAVRHECFLPVNMGMINDELWKKVLDTDLHGTCGPVLSVQECATAKMTSEDCRFTLLQNDSMVLELRRAITAANITVNHICRDHVEVFDEHKDCLLRRDGDNILLVQTIQQQCHIQTLDDAVCPPARDLACAVKAVLDQCGHVITGELRSLHSKLLQQLGCSATHKRYKVMKKEIYSPLKLMQKGFHWLF